MMNTILKKIPFSIVMRCYYYYYHFKKKRFLERLIEKKRYHKLDEVDLSGYKTSEKLFVIGSGASLNDITSEEWKEINRHDSIGFNFSFLNKDHIPTFYTCEGMLPIDVNSKGRSPVADLYYRLYKTKKQDYKNVIKFVTDLDDNRLSHFENYGKDLFDDNLYVLNTVNGIADDRLKLKKLLNYYQALGLFDVKSKLDKVFKFRATLVMAISFGINMGYKEIILCGIDLNDPRYFYQNKEKYPDFPDFRSSPNTSRHATILPDNLFAPVDVVIDEMRKSICERKEIKMYIQNPNSALNQILPVYSFES